MVTKEEILNLRSEKTNSFALFCGKTKAGFFAVLERETGEEYGRKNIVHL